MSQAHLNFEKAHYSFLLSEKEFIESMLVAHPGHEYWSKALESNKEQIRKWVKAFAHVEAA